MERIEEAARQWIEEHKNEYKSLNVERKECEFIFTISAENGNTCSFTVTCPETDDGSWVRI